MIDFQVVKAEVSFAQAIEKLGLEGKWHGHVWRGKCPACNTEDDRALVITEGRAWYCFSAKKGGDVIALAQHQLDVSVKEAAEYLAGTSTSTVHSTSTSEVRKDRAKFDPAQFAAKLQYTDAVKALGYSEEEAKTFRIGSHRGHVYIPTVYPSGAIAGWSKLDGELTRPTNWLPDASNVVPFKKAG